MAGNLNFGAIFYIFFRQQLETSHAQQGGGGAQNGLSVGEDGYCVCSVHSVVAFKLVGNGCFHSLDKMSALGVEFKVGLGKFVGHPLAAVHETALAVEHILKIVVVAIHFVVHGEDSAEYSLVAPIEHVTCVGAHLIVARQ